MCFICSKSTNWRVNTETVFSIFTHHSNISQWFFLFFSLSLRFQLKVGERKQRREREKNKWGKGGETGNKVSELSVFDFISLPSFFTLFLSSLFLFFLSLCSQLTGSLMAMIEWQFKTCCSNLFSLPIQALLPSFSILFLHPLSPSFSSLTTSSRRRRRRK